MLNRLLFLAGLGGMFLMYKLLGGMFGVDNYSMTVADAQAKLASMAMPEKGGPFGALEVSVSKPSKTQVRWTASGSHAHFECDANIEAVDETSVKVSSSCKGSSPSDGVTADAHVEATEVAMNEFVDSTLRGRPYDSQRVATASGAVFMKGYPGMVKDAIKMDIDMHKAQADYQKEKAEAAANPPPKPASGFGADSYQPEVKFGDPTSAAAPTSQSDFGKPTSTGAPTGY
jgi:hypothetical protein